MHIKWILKTTRNLIANHLWKASVIETYSDSRKLFEHLTLVLSYSFSSFPFNKLCCGFEHCQSPGIVHDIWCYSSCLCVCVSLLHHFKFLSALYSIHILPVSKINNNPTACNEHQVVNSFRYSLRCVKLTAHRKSQRNSLHIVVSFASNSISLCMVFQGVCVPEAHRCGEKRTNCILPLLNESYFDICVCIDA